MTAPGELRGSELDHLRRHLQRNVRQERAQHPDRAAARTHPSRTIDGLAPDPGRTRARCAARMTALLAQDTAPLLVAALNAAIGRRRVVGRHDLGLAAERGAAHRTPPRILGRTCGAGSPGYSQVRRTTHGDQGTVGVYPHLAPASAPLTVRLPRAEHGPVRRAGRGPQRLRSPGVQSAVDCSNADTARSRATNAAPDTWKARRERKQRRPGRTPRCSAGSAVAAVGQAGEEAPAWARSALTTGRCSVINSATRRTSSSSLNSRAFTGHTHGTRMRRVWCSMTAGRYIRAPANVTVSRKSAGDALRRRMPR
ncbi:hypothetical protein amrb99_68100 [Actinomadura sp. RB99]|nr:hypothetical protein [Actinomadura sp. RB99]